MILLPLLVAAITVAPADRLALADRLFNRGEFAAARAEYAALTGEKTLAADEILYRLAECDRSLGNTASARGFYSKLLAEHPHSKRVERARLMMALGAEGRAKIEALRLLDTDGTENSVRAAALYHLGEFEQDPAFLERCVKLDPKGRYAAYAKFQRAVLLAKDGDPAKHRDAVTLLLEIAFGEKGEFAEEALYLAASTSFTDAKYGEAASLLHRYLRNYPEGRHRAQAGDFCAWSDYLAGKYTQAIADCGEGKTDDTAYVKASAVYLAGDAVKAKGLFRKYLEDWPQGRYRKDVELPLARIEFDEAGRSGDTARGIETARRAASLSGSAVDRMRLCWAFEKAGKTEEAAREYLALAAKHPGAPEAAEAMFRKGLIDVRAGRWQAAELALKEALAGSLDGRRRPEALYWRGISACRSDHVEEGTGFLREAVKAGLPLDQSREARLMIADADFNAGRRPEALASYTELVREGAADRMSAAKTHAVGKLLAPPEKKLCAQALVKCGSEEWRQSGYALLGEAEEEAGNLAAATEAWNECMKIPCTTEAAAPVAVKLGWTLSKYGSHDAAEKMLRRAVELNVKDDVLRASAYLGLALNAEAKGDLEAAKGYATVVVTLFENTPSAAGAKGFLERVKEDGR